MCTYAFGDEDAQGGADGVLAGAVRLAQMPFGWQGAAGRVGAVLDVFPQVIGDPLVQRPVRRRADHRRNLVA
jgi:hypothetical protein